MYGKQFLKIALYLATLCTAAASDLSESTSDSSHYHELRKQYSREEQNFAIIRTADALAREGFYSEALEVILTSAQEPDMNEGIQSATRGLWHLSTGMDYSRLEEIDSAGMTLEERQEFRRLTRMPLAVWARARRNIELGEKAEVRPEIYISGYKARLEIPFRRQFVKNKYSVQITPEGEKWFNTSAGSQDIRPFRADSSDMGGGDLTALCQSTDTDSDITWSLPFTMDWEHYRIDRSGYESFIEYNTTPFFEYRNNGLPISASLTGELRFRNYYRTWADSLDLIEGMISVHTSFVKNRFSIQAETDYLKSLFINAQALSRTDRMNMSARIDLKVNNNISSQLYARGLFLNEEYEKYNLQGKEMLLRPGVRFFRGSFFTETELSVQNRWTSETNDCYIWQPGLTWEPTLRGGVSFNTLDLSLFAGYRQEDVEGPFEKFTPDSKSIKTGINGSFSLFSGWMIFGLIDYQYRIYDAKNRKSENLTVSLSVAADL